MNSSSLPVPFKNKHRMVSINTSCDSLLDIPELFSSCLDRMPPHIWFNVVSYDVDSNDDLSYATWQPVDLLRKVMLHLNYITI